MGKSNQKSGRFYHPGGKFYHPDGVVEFLTARHPAKTAEHVEALAGIPAETFRNWRRGLASPSGEAIMRLTVAYGPDILAAICPSAPDWLRGAIMARRQAEIETEQERLARALAELTGKI